MFRNILLFGAVAKLLKEEFGVDVEEVLQQELTEEEKEAIGEKIDSLCIDTEKDMDEIAVEELVEILKELLDKLKQQ